MITLVTLLDEVVACAQTNFLYHVDVVVLFGFQRTKVIKVTKMTTPGRVIRLLDHLGRRPCDELDREFVRCHSRPIPVHRVQLGSRLY